MSVTQCCTDLVNYGCCRDTVRVLDSVVLTWFSVVGVVTTVIVVHSVVLTWFSGVGVVTTVRVVHSCTDLVQRGWCRDNGKSGTQCYIDLVQCGWCRDGYCRDNGKTVTQCCTDLVYYGCCRDTVRVLHSVVLTWFITAVVVTPYECYTVLY